MSNNQKIIVVLSNNNYYEEIMLNKEKSRLFEWKQLKTALITTLFLSSIYGMKRNIFIIAIILISFSCSLFEGENDSYKLPSGWTKVEGLKGGLVKTFFTDDNHIYVGTKAHGVVYSDKNTENWIEINGGLNEIDPEYNSTLDRRSINAFIKLDGELYAGIETAVSVGNYVGKDYEYVGGLYKYIKGKNRWEYLGFKELSIFDIEVIDDKLVVGTFDGIYILEEVEGNWIKTNIGFDGIDWSSIAVVDNTIFAARVWSLVKSSDLGENWTDVHTSNIANHPINCIVSIEDTLYVGTDNGVYISNDFGNNWIEKNNGIPYEKTTGYSSVNQLTFSGSKIIATYLLDTFYSGDDTPSRISSGLLYTSLNDFDWNVIELADNESHEDEYKEPFSLGTINNKILVGIIKSGFVGSKKNEVWINTTILNEQ